MSGRIVVVGSLNLDSTLRVDQLPAPGETVHSDPVLRAPGGKGANQAVAAALLGGDVSLSGAVGDDDAGRLLVGAAAKAGVDVSAVRVAPGPSGHATIVVDRGAENIIIVDGGANRAVNAAEVRTDLTAADVVVTGNELSDAVVVAAAEQAVVVGAIVVHNPSPFRPLPAGMPHPDVIVVNEHEFEMLGGAPSDDDGPKLPAALQRGAVIVTRGAGGALVIEAGSETSVPAPPVVAVDTSGCGDAFLGAVAERLAAGCPIVAATEFAVRVGAIAATRPGTQSSYPTIAELSMTADSVPG